MKRLDKVFIIDYTKYTDIKINKKIMSENPKQKEERAKRDAEIFSLWPALTLQEIGKRYINKKNGKPLTAERVRQILRKVEKIKIKK